MLRLGLQGAISEQGGFEAQVVAPGTELLVTFCKIRLLQLLDVVCSLKCEACVDNPHRTLCIKLQNPKH